jgi:hypothetical protein
MEYLSRSSYNPDEHSAFFRLLEAVPTERGDVISMLKLAFGGDDNEKEECGIPPD